MAGNRRLKSVEESRDRPLQLYLTYRLAALSAKLNRQAGVVLKRAGNLRIPEWRILALLSLHGELTGSAIADRVGFDPGLVSRAFRGLERRGLVAVRRTDDDRRNVYMSLTRRDDFVRQGLAGDATPAGASCGVSERAGARHVLSRHR